MAEVFNEKVEVQNNQSNTTVLLNGETGDIDAGGNGAEGDLRLFDSNQNSIIHLSARNGIVRIGGGSSEGTPGPDGDVLVRDNNGNTTIRIDGKAGNIRAGGNGSNGDIFLQDSNGNTTIRIDGQRGNVRAGGGGTNGDLLLLNKSGNTTIHIDGEAGDITLANADCAEEFDVDTTQIIDPGTVMVINPSGGLQQSNEAYDKKVAGVVSGAGDYKPGIVLDKQKSSGFRVPIAMMGKVYCKVDASYAAVEVGDLLTTSSTPGYAMKASDPLKSFGTVIGKALCPLTKGQGLIPVLVALQ